MNYTLTPAMKSRFKDYLAAAAQSGRDLQLVLENLGVQWHADYSLESLELAEVVFWKMVSGELKDPVVSTAHFADLIARYLGEIVARAGRGKWAQSEEP